MKIIGLQVPVTGVTMVFTSETIHSAIQKRTNGS